MATHQRAAALLRLLLAAAAVAALAAAPAVAAAAKPLPVVLYGESLCDSSAHYIVDVLGPLFDDGVITQMELRYEAYGNAKLNETTGEVTCQHGEEECLGNNIILCAQKARPEQAAWFPFVRCLAEPLAGNLTATDHASYVIETSALFEEALPLCAAQNGFALDALLECAQGAEGEALEAQAAAATAALQPSHLGVPWVTAAGQSLGGNTPTLAATGLFVCTAAPVDARPPACEQLALDVNKEE